MERIFIIFLILVSCKKQQSKSVISECLSIKQVNLLNEMISSFESDICVYYDLSKDNSQEAIIKYLKDIKTNETDSIVLKIASVKSKNLLEKSFFILSDDVWITYLEEIESSSSSNLYEKKQEQVLLTNKDSIYEVSGELIEDDFADIPILENGEVLKDRLEKDSISKMRMMEEFKNKHLLRIYGEFVDCIYKETRNESSKKLYESLIIAGRISPRILINGLVDLDSKYLNSLEIKAYIALDLFYSPLDFNLK